MTSLGNFLSGMETIAVPEIGIPPPPSLETSLVEWKRRYPWPPEATRYRLGNFLSGMETYLGSYLHVAFVFLGNFLSGMETTAPKQRQSPCRRPWKLP